MPIVQWLHMLGFRGHFTKSRRFSTTLGRLRAERRSWRRRHEPNRWPADLDDDQDGSTLVIVRDGAFDGISWLTAGDAALAAARVANTASTPATPTPTKITTERDKT
jgi:hypothetical protein